MDSIFRKDVLRGKIALITGGGSGIGLEISKCLVEHGAKAVLLGRNLKRLEDALGYFQKDTCSIAQCDVRNTDHVAKAVKQAIDLHGKIDILINCAAGNFLAPFETLTSKGFKTVIEIDTIGTFNVTKEVFTQSMKSGGGIIINISSTLQMPAVNMISHAAAAKAAIDSLTRSLAVELGPRRIRVNGVAPGMIEGTEGLSRLNPAKDVKLDGKVPQIPLQRSGKKSEIAQAVLFLILAEYITGQTLVVDGGLVLSFPNFTLAFPDVFQAWSSKL